MGKKFAILLITIWYAIPYQIAASDKKDSPTNTSNRSSHEKEGIFSHIDETNLISNPGFENWTSNWTLGKYNGGTGLFLTDSIKVLTGTQSAIIFTENQEQDYSDVQLFSFLEVSKNTLYAVSFKASVSKVCLISISVGNGIETFFEEKFLLRPEKINYGPFIFNSEVDEPFSFFSFNLGRTSNEILFDEIVIQADYTEKEFNKVLANTGINVNQTKEKELYISLPTACSDDYPVIFTDENGKAVSTTKIRKGEQEIHFALNSVFIEGRYILKIFTPSRTLAYNFTIE